MTNPFWRATTPSTRPLGLEDIVRGAEAAERAMDRQMVVTRELAALNDTDALCIYLRAHGLSLRGIAEAANTTVEHAAEVIAATATRISNDTKDRGIGMTVTIECPPELVAYLQIAVAELTGSGVVDSRGLAPAALTKPLSESDVLAFIVGHIVLTLDRNGVSNVADALLKANRIFPDARNRALREEVHPRVR